MYLCLSASADVIVAEGGAFVGFGAIGAAAAAAAGGPM